MGLISKKNVDIFIKSHGSHFNTVWIFAFIEPKNPWGCIVEWMKIRRIKRSRVAWTEWIGPFFHMTTLIEKKRKKQSHTKWKKFHWIWTHNWMKPLKKAHNLSNIFYTLFSPIIETLFARKTTKFDKFIEWRFCLSLFFPSLMVCSTEFSCVLHNLA